MLYVLIGWANHVQQLILQYVDGGRVVAEERAEPAGGCSREGCLAVPSEVYRRLFPLPDTAEEVEAPYTEREC